MTADSINGEVQKQLGHIRDQLSGFQKAVHQDVDDDADLAALRVKADAIISEMQALSDKLKDRGEQIQSRLTALGDPPKAGAPAETPVVTEERTRLTNERAELNVVTENATQLSNSAVQLGNTITNLRRSLFARTLFRHTEITPDLFVEAGQAQRYQFTDFTSTVGSWLNFVIRFKPLQLIGALALSIGAGLLFLFGGYRLLGRLIRRNDGQEAPSYIRRLSVAFWSTITETMALAAFLASSFLFLDGFNVLRSDVSTMVASFFGTVWFVFFVAKLSNAVLAPRDQDWRLVRVTNRGAKYLSVAVISMAVINSLDYFLTAVSEALSSPLALTIVKSLVASVMISLIVAFISFLKPIMAVGGDPEERGRAWPRFLPLLMRLISIVLLLSAVSGYIGLARFLSTQLVLTSAVLVLIYIGLLSGKAISKQGAFRDTGAGRWLGNRFKFGDVALDQSGLLAGSGSMPLRCSSASP